MKIMVSACLLGENCKYNGGNNYNPRIIEYIKNHEVIPICPECLGGLPVPRCPSDIVNGTVMMKNGRDVDKEFHEGASIALKKAIDEKVDCIILQSRSPSCGIKEIYDGSFTGTKIKGMGIFARMAKDAGFLLIDKEEI